MAKPVATLNMVMGAAIAALLTAPPALATAPAVGKKLPIVKLGDDLGGRVDGSAWSSEMIKDKVWLLFYVDPDRKDINTALETALKDQNFPKDKYGSIGIINMDATWLPNAAIASALKSKQEEYPDTVYVKDMKKTLVNAWKLTDDEYDVVAFDKQGVVFTAKDGEFSKKDIDALIAAIKAHL